MPDREKIAVLDDPLELLIGWLAVTVAGYFLGAWGGQFLMVRVELGPRIAEIFIAGAIQGLCIGFGQWWFLRGRLPLAALWILVSVAGFSLISLLQGVAAPLIRLSAMLEVVLIIIQGGLLGLVQWLYLRRQVPEAHWWIVACASATFIHSQLARIVFFFAPDQWLFDVVGAVTLGAVTSYTIFALIERRPKDAPKPEKLYRSLRPRPNRYKRPNKAAAEAKLQESSEPPAPPVSRPEPEPREIRAPASGGPPERLVLVKKKIRLQETGGASIASADFAFVLPGRPRRARLHFTYSGMSAATQAHFRQQIQLNDQLLLEIQPRGRKLSDAEEYVLRIEAEAFSRSNRIVFVSQSQGRPQNRNPFVLHAARLEFDW